MELRQLKTFLVVADLLNFNQSANQLHFAQSTVSARIKALEEEVGVPLFDRLGKKVALTEAGRMLVRYAKKIIALEEETLAEVNGKKEHGGSISIRIPQSLGNQVLPHILKDFSTGFPFVNIDVNTCTFTQLKRELRTGITDVAFLLYDAVHKVDLKSEVLGCVNLTFICSNNSEFKDKTNITMKDLEKTPVLLPKYDCRYKTFLTQTFAELNINPVIFEINSVETIRTCVKQGVGISLLPEFSITNQLTAGDFSTFLVNNHQMETAILMILHKDKWQSKPLKNFIELTKKYIKKLN